MKLYYNDKLFSGISGLLKKGWRINSRGRLTPIVFNLNFDLPWVFIKPCRVRKCQIWTVYFRSFGIIPKFCREQCWKTVARPKSFKEAFSLYHKMIGLNLPSKIGIDLRSYTKGPWGAYFYSCDEQQAKERHRFISQTLGESHPLILKKSCTEMEMQQKTNEMTGALCDPENLEPILNDIFELKGSDGQIQPDWLKNKIIIDWVKHAKQIGDMSYMDHIGCLPSDEIEFVQYQDEVKEN